MSCSYTRNLGDLLTGALDGLATSWRMAIDSLWLAGCQFRNPPLPKKGNGPSLNASKSSIMHCARAISGIGPPKKEAYALGKVSTAPKAEQCHVSGEGDSN